MMKKTRTREDEDEEDAGRGAWTMRKDEGQGPVRMRSLPTTKEDANERWQGKEGEGG